jgi:hypothetical protein
MTCWEMPMKLGACVLLSSLITIALAGAALPSHAIQDGRSLQGRSFVSGGVSDEELASLHAQRQRYSLWVITAAAKSGAYLADVQVKVIDANQRTVLETKLDGPWLLTDLELGRYTVEASFNGETQRGITTIHPGDHHQVFFYFGVPANLSPDRDISKPFGDKKP